MIGTRSLLVTNLYQPFETDNKEGLRQWERKVTLNDSQNLGFSFLIHYYILPRSMNKVYHHLFITQGKGFKLCTGADKKTLYVKAREMSPVAHFEGPSLSPPTLGELIDFPRRKTLSVISPNHVSYEES